MHIEPSKHDTQKIIFKISHNTVIFPYVSIIAQKFSAVKHNITVIKAHTSIIFHNMFSISSLP